MFNEDKKIRIPKEFTLFGHTYTVVFDDTLFEKENCYGTADDDLKQIKLQPTGAVRKKYVEGTIKQEIPLVITDKVLAETFFHEMVHIMLFFRRIQIINR